MSKKFFKAEMDNLEEMIQFILLQAKRIVKNRKIDYQLRLVSEEAFINIINYAYGKESGELKIDCKIVNNDTIFIEIIDTGTAFDPLQKEDPDITLPLEEIKDWGLGIFIIKNIMDTVHYKREDEQNILTLTKKLL
ncbi:MULTISPECIES: ATP-binding protein [Psychrilyobacter]|nr:MULTISPECIES: ATP-binding protein [Psychrilyobacter]MCS5421212.1 ATP-binding protein [Psychrilyobacter sp. S5]NDI77597.1 ATP-binding protein [Psychrilyobacter piezotolerans]